MAIRVVRPGSPRDADEGIRIETVRRPLRGVPKALFATQNWYDVWFPSLGPVSKPLKGFPNPNAGCVSSNSFLFLRSPTFPDSYPYSPALPTNAGGLIIVLSL
jgi:hypothetical protein